MIQHLRARVRDDLGEMFVRRMATIHQCAQEELEQFLFRQRQRTHAVAAQFDAVLAWCWRTYQMRSWAIGFDDLWDLDCSTGAEKNRRIVSIIYAKLNSQRARVLRGIDEVAVASDRWLP